MFKLLHMTVSCFQSLSGPDKITCFADFLRENITSSTENRLLHILAHNYYLFDDFNILEKEIKHVQCAMWPMQNSNSSINKIMK